MKKSKSLDAIFKKNSYLIDVRSPLEFQQGHIPHAVNIPLFTNEERAEVGITYKQLGKNAAIEKGLSLVKLPAFVEKLHSLKAPSELVVYCARGGLRSSSMGWLFGLLGYDVTIIEGGYKFFRNWAIIQFAKQRTMIVLAGKTGSGKTEILKRLLQQKEKILDLEALACHRGSSFGAMEQGQPTQEQFENDLALALFEIGKRAFWVEDESRFVGKIRIPDALFNQMQSAKTVVVQATLEERIERILKDYSGQKKEDLQNAITRLQKKLGMVAMREALLHLEKGNYAECTKILLAYYDKSYANALSKREKSSIIEAPKNLSQLAAFKKTLLAL